MAGPCFDSIPRCFKISNRSMACRVSSEGRTTSSRSLKRTGTGFLSVPSSAVPEADAGHRDIFSGAQYRPADIHGNSPWPCAGNDNSRRGVNKTYREVPAFAGPARLHRGKQWGTGATRSGEDCFCRTV